MFCAAISLIVEVVSVLCCRQVDSGEVSVLCCRQVDSGGGKCFLLPSS